MSGPFVTMRERVPVAEIERVTPEGLIRYLTDSGWTRGEPWQGGALFSKDGRHATVVPRHFGDWMRRTVEALQAGADEGGLSVWVVVHGAIKASGGEL